LTPNFAVEGGEMKSLACWVGRHRWTTRIEHGEEYNTCEACGTTPRSRAFLQGGKREIAGGYGFKLVAVAVFVAWVVALVLIERMGLGS
jgi:hypothetical protein